ncbi:hypothetical protein [Pedobacter sp. SYP-B3415]|uniref:hypothetical protein n=1 Tax=Pedobacter sp. SYP-B3415 TaxID=2496641 RepID=UPI00101C12FB|nr:hypothetical protein [Pedobacter sp. SYP-B3415]
MLDFIVIFSFLSGIFLFFRSLYDVYRTPLLNKRDKTSMAYLICMLPVAGSFIFYYFLFRIRRGQPARRTLSVLD